MAVGMGPPAAPLVLQTCGGGVGCRFYREPRPRPSAGAKDWIMSYKRNQVEEAIAHIFFPDCEKPPSELRTRIKRLLDLDRSIGRKLRSKDAAEANFGFFSEEAPGTGPVPGARGCQTGCGGRRATAADNARSPDAHYRVFGPAS
jgi:hypothetical protein